MLQSVMHETLKSNESNDYRLPHNQKYQIEPKDMLSFNIECKDDFIDSVRKYSAA